MRKTMFNVVLALIALPAFFLADDVAPDAMLKAITLDVISIIKQDKGMEAGRPPKLVDVVEAKILPLFDFTRMTDNAMADKSRLATPGQREALAKRFQMLLALTFSTALLSYDGQIIDYRLLQPATRSGDVTVESVISRRGKEPLTIDYQMEKGAAGWKVYDIRIAGISLTSAYRQEFAGKVRGASVDSLVKLLAD